MELHKLIFKEKNGSLVPGKTLIPMSDVERNAKALEDLRRTLKDILNKLIKTIIVFGFIAVIILLIVIWKFYSTGYFNQLLAGCGG